MLSSCLVFGLCLFFFFFFIDPAPTEISPLPLHDALPICGEDPSAAARPQNWPYPEKVLGFAAHPPFLPGISRKAGARLPLRRVERKQRGRDREGQRAVQPRTRQAAGGAVLRLLEQLRSVEN